MNWQKIETAPRDGTEIVLWCAHGGRMLMSCRWSGVEWKEYCIGGFDSMGWYNLESYEKPTHWMRLIPPDPTL